MCQVKKGRRASQINLLKRGVYFAWTPETFNLFYKLRIRKPVLMTYALQQ